LSDFGSLGYQLIRGHPLCFQSFKEAAILFDSYPVVKEIEPDLISLSNDKSQIGRGSGL
jgi:hypothetical protein